MTGFFTKRKKPAVFSKNLIFEKPTKNPRPAQKPHVAEFRKLTAPSRARAALQQRLLNSTTRASLKRKKGRIHYPPRSLKGTGLMPVLQGPKRLESSW